MTIRGLVGLVLISALAFGCSDDSSSDDGGSGGGGDTGGTGGGGDSGGTGGGGDVDSGTGGTGGGGAVDVAACVSAYEMVAPMAAMVTEAACVECLCEACGEGVMSTCDDPCWAAAACGQEAGCDEIADQMEATTCFTGACAEHIPAAIMQPFMDLVACDTSGCADACAGSGGGGDSDGGT